MVMFWKKKILKTTPTISWILHFSIIWHVLKYVIIYVSEKLFPERINKNQVNSNVKKMKSEIEWWFLVESTDMDRMSELRLNVPTKSVSAQLNAFATSRISNLDTAYMELVFSTMFNFYDHHFNSASAMQHVIF